MSYKDDEEFNTPEVSIGTEREGNDGLLEDDESDDDLSFNKEDKERGGLFSEDDEDDDLGEAVGIDGSSDY